MTRAAPIALLLLLACAPEPQAPAGEDGWGPTLAEVGEPRRAHVVPRALPIPESERTRWEHADALPDLRAVAVRSRSEHLDGVYDRTVLVNAAAGAYENLTRGSAALPGALVVQRHHPRGAESVVVYFAMERLAKGSRPAARDWRFLVVDETLRVAASDNLQPCARCHADAPFDGLFGIAVHAID